MKKVFFGLLVVATALGASAFTNAKNVKRSFTNVYYQTATGVYTPSLPAGSCSVSTPTPCTITLANPIDTDDYPTLNYSSQTSNDVPAAAGAISESLSKFRY